VACAAGIVGIISVLLLLLLLPLPASCFSMRTANTGLSV
jgi:hypothetical protein